MPASRANRVSDARASAAASGRCMATHAATKLGLPSVAYTRSRWLPPAISGVQPAAGAQIPGIRRWPEAYLPAIYEPSRVDRVMDVGQREAEETTRLLAAREGIFAGVSSGGAVAAALRLGAEVQGAVIVCVVCDRGDRYLSTGVFNR